MQKFKNFLRKHKVVLILLSLSIPAFYQIVRPGFFPMQDDLQAFRLQQMDKCFKDFQIPCRWIPDMGYQYGYPQFQFYSPSVFYLGEVFHLIGFQFIDSIKILFILGFVFSLVSMFVFLRSFFGELPAVLGALFYLYTPFRAAQVYVRGSLNEFWALVFFPLIFWSSMKLAKQKQTKYAIYLGIFLSLLLITHNLMSMIFLPVFIVWALLWICLEKGGWQTPIESGQTWKKNLAAGALAFGLSAFFILPLIFEKQFVHIESLVGGYFDYRQHFVNLYQLFVSNYFGFGSSVLGPGDEVSMSTGIIQWVVAAAGLVILTFSWKKHKKLALIAFALGAAEVLVLFLMHQKSSFIWERLTFLGWLQFPWRFLGLSIFLLSILSACTIYLLPKRAQRFATTALIAVVFVLNVSNFTPREWLDISDKIKFSGVSWEKQITISIFDYLPIFAKLPPNKKAPELPEALEGDVNFFEYRKKSNSQLGKMGVLSKDAWVRFPIFDFPGMKLFVNGKEYPHRHDLCQGQDFCFGLVSANFSQGLYNVEVKLTKTWPRKAGDLISLGTLTVLAGLYIKRIYEKNH